MSHNLLNNIDYRVFPMTYLKNVVFQVTFSAIDMSCYQAAGNFFNETFGLTLSESRFKDIENSPLAFVNAAGSLRWLMSDTFIRIMIEQETYRSFNDTLIPLIKLLQDLLNAVRRTPKSLVFEKINLIPSPLSSVCEMRAKAKEIFSDNLIREWSGTPYLEQNNSLLFQNKTTPDSKTNIETISGFILKDGSEENMQPSRYVLDIVSRTSDIPATGDLIETATKINKYIFTEFINSVTSKIVRSMEGEDNG